MKIKRFIIPVVTLLLLMVLGISQFHQADAGPGSHGRIYSVAAVTTQNDTVINRILLPQQVYTMANTTPVNGSTVCLPGDPDSYAARLTLSGTMTGTAPTVDVNFYSSDDGGTTWTQVGSAFAVINATVTPTGGKERVTFADTEEGAVNTPVLYANCFKVTTTWGGTGTVTANLGVSLYAE